MYTPVKLNITVDQHEKLKNAIIKQKAVSIKVNTNHGGGGKHVILLTHSQIQRMERAKLIGKSTLNIHLSKKQVKANIQHRGGFLGMLAGLAAKALPTLLGGLATGLVSGAVEKAVGGRGLYLHPSGRRSNGDGLYLHKSGHCVKVEPTKGKGLRLTPNRSNLIGVHGDGLYVKRGSQVYDGRGLLLGRNSPFKNIPILNLLL